MWIVVREGQIARVGIEILWMGIGQEIGDLPAIDNAENSTILLIPYPNAGDSL